MHPGSIVEITAGRLDLAAEWRTFVVDGTVCRPSPYRIGDATWEPGFDRRTDIPTASAHRMAADVAAGLTADRKVPDAWVLDVAVAVDGCWVVVEANAAWSSGTYGCDLRHVADAAARASTGPVDRRWRWQPDPTEAAAADAAAPLRAA